MPEVEILRNEVPDTVVARRFEREIEEAAAAAGPGERLRCAILDEGLHAEIEVELPEWKECAPVAYPARPGDARRAMTRLLRSVGLAPEPSLPLAGEATRDP